MPVKINWNTLASVVAALCGVAMITILPFAQSWLKLTLDNQHAQISQEVAGVYEKQAAHDADLNRIAAVTEKLSAAQSSTEQRANQTDLTVQHLKDVISRRDTVSRSTSNE